MVLKCSNQTGKWNSFSITTSLCVAGSFGNRWVEQCSYRSTYFFGTSGDGVRWTNKMNSCDQPHTDIGFSLLYSPSVHHSLGLSYSSKYWEAIQLFFVGTREIFHHNQECHIHSNMRCDGESSSFCFVINVFRAQKLLVGMLIILLMWNGLHWKPNIFCSIIQNRP